MSYCNSGTSIYIPLWKFVELLWREQNLFAKLSNFKKVKMWYGIVKQADYPERSIYRFHLINVLIPHELNAFYFHNVYIQCYAYF